MPVRTATVAAPLTLPSRPGLTLGPGTYEMQVVVETAEATGAEVVTEATLALSATERVPLTAADLDHLARHPEVMIGSAS